MIDATIFSAVDARLYLHRLSVQYPNLNELKYFDVFIIPWRLVESGWHVFEKLIRLRCIALWENDCVKKEEEESFQ